MADPKRSFAQAEREPGIRGRATGSAAKNARRLPDKPWRYNPPAAADVAGPKPVSVPKEDAAGVDDTAGEGRDIQRR